MELTLPKKGAFCLCGVPQKEQLSFLLRWLDEAPDRYLLIFDDKELSLKHDRLFVYGCALGDIKRAAEEFVFVPLVFAEADHKQVEIFKQLEDFSRKAFLMASIVQDRGVLQVKNLIANASLQASAFCGETLFGQFQKVPAIICGAGPSLEKAMPQLRRFKDQALIFAGGHALGILAQEKITPHFGGIVDPHEPSEFLQELPLLRYPLFYQDSSCPTLVAKHQGPLLRMPGNRGEFFQDSHFEGGWNVATFLSAIACHLGCSPIICVGVDLSYAKGKVYANGACEKEHTTGAIENEDGSLSRQDWLEAASFLGQMAESHVEVDWINASSGLVLDHFQKKELHQIQLDDQKDLSGQIHALLCQIQHQKKSQIIAADQILGDVDRCGQLAKKALGQIEALFPKDPSSNGEYVLTCVEYEQERAFEAFFSPLWKIWEPIFARQLKGRPFLELEINRWLFIQGICNEIRAL